MSQTIEVHGVGIKEDSGPYGSNGHPPSTMEGIANIIAGEIIGQPTFPTVRPSYKPGPKREAKSQEEDE